MSRLLRVAALAAVATVVGGCGDDHDAADATTTTTEADGAGATSELPTTTTTTIATTAPPGDGAQDPPASEVPAEEGLGDPLVFAADLSGAAVVPGPGDPDAAGRIEIESVEVGAWCVDMDATGLDGAAVGAHVHFGPEGRRGDAVVPLGPPGRTDAGAATWTDVCVEVDERTVEEVLASPGSFYADVHTREHPDGAARGQLALSSIFERELP